MVPAKIRKQAPILKWLKTAKPKEVKSFIKAADKSFICTLCECCLNVLRGNIPLTPKQKQKLKRHKTGLRQLANKKIPIHRKKALLLKGGSLLGALIPTVISLVGGLFGLK